MTEEYQAFLGRLCALGNGDRAALKRAAGVMLSDADGKAVAAFYRCIPMERPSGRRSDGSPWPVCGVCGMQIWREASRLNRSSAR